MAQMNTCSPTVSRSYPGAQSGLDMHLAEARI
jgi:hypothetical protein